MPPRLRCQHCAGNPTSNDAPHTPPKLLRPRCPGDDAPVSRGLPAVLLAGRHRRLVPGLAGAHRCAAGWPVPAAAVPLAGKPADLSVPAPLPSPLPCSYQTIHTDHEGGNVSAHATHLVRQRPQGCCVTTLQHSPLAALLLSRQTTASNSGSPACPCHLPCRLDRHSPTRTSPLQPA